MVRRIRYPKKRRFVQSTHPAPATEGSNERTGQQRIPIGTETVVRADRATQDELFPVIDQLEVLGRLITAISFQNGLITEKIPSDEALAELLNVGSMDLGKLEAFKKDTIEKFIGTLNKLKVDADQDVEYLEEKLLLLGEWRRVYGSIGDVKDMKLAKEYFAEVAKAKAYAFDSKLFTNVKNNIEALKPALETVLNLPDSVPATEHMVYYVAFLTLSSACKGLDTFLQSLDGWIISLDKLDFLITIDSLASTPQHKFQMLVAVVSENLGKVDRKTRPNHITELSHIIVNVSNATQPPDTDNVASMEILGLLVTSRAVPVSKSSRNHTSGFLHGHLDMEKLPKDAEESSIGPFLGIVQPILKDGLAPLKSFNAKFNEIAKTWNQLSSETSVETARKVLQTTAGFDAIRKLSPNVYSFLNTTLQCADFPNINTGFPADMMILTKKAMLLKHSLPTIRQKAVLIRDSSLLKPLKDFVKLKDILKIPMKPTLDDVPLFIKNFRTFKNTQNFIDTLVKLKPLVNNTVTELKKHDVNQMINDLSEGEKIFNDFISHQNAKDIIRIFECLKGTLAFEPVSLSIKLIHEIRNLQNDPNFRQLIGTMAGVIESSLPTIKETRGIPLRIRGTQDPQVHELMRLAEISTESHDFGISLTVLENIREILMKKDSLVKLIDLRPDVEFAISEEKDAKKRSEMEEEWGDFGQTQRKVRELLSRLEQKNNQTVVPSASKFADYGPFFVGFSNLGDVDLRVRSRLRVLGKLPAATPGVADLKMLLKELDPLDLEFSKFQTLLSRLSRSLSNLDTVFANFAASVTVPSTPGIRTTSIPPLPPSTQISLLLATIPSSIPTTNIATTEATSYPFALIYIGGGVCVLCAGISGVWFVVRCCQKKDESAKSRYPLVKWALWLMKKLGKVEPRSITPPPTPDPVATPPPPPRPAAQPVAQPVAPPPPPPVNPRGPPPPPRQAAQPAAQQVDQPAAQQVDQPAAQQAAQPVAQQAAQPAAQQAAQPVAQQAAQPAAQQAAQPAAQQAAQPAAQQDAQPAAPPPVDPQDPPPPPPGIVGRARQRAPPRPPRHIDNRVVFVILDTYYHLNYHDLRVQLFELSQQGYNVEGLHRAMVDHGVREAVRRGVPLRHAYYDYCARVIYHFHRLIDRPETRRDNVRATIEATSFGGTSHLHGNNIRMPIYGVYKITQAPMGDNHPGRLNTIERFYEMIHGDRVREIVSMSLPHENDPYYPTNDTERELTFGDYRVTLINENPETFGGFFVQRELLLKRLSTGVTRRVYHYQATSDNFANDAFRAQIVELRQLLGRRETPVCVHSIRGTGRAAVFVTMAFVHQLFVQHRGNINFESTVAQLRRWSAGFIETGYHYCAAHVLSCESLERNVDDLGYEQPSEGIRVQAGYLRTYFSQPALDEDVRRLAEYRRRHHLDDEDQRNLPLPLLPPRHEEHAPNGQPRVADGAQPRVAEGAQPRVAEGAQPRVAEGAQRHAADAAAQPNADQQHVAVAQPELPPPAAPEADV